jgi:hypothetical protein
MYLYINNNNLYNFIYSITFFILYLISIYTLINLVNHININIILINDNNFGVVINRDVIIRYG